MGTFTNNGYGIFDEHDEQLLDRFLTAKIAFRSPDQRWEVDYNVLCISSYYSLQDAFVRCVRWESLDVSKSQQT